jgi:hypothetical protein
LNELTNIKEIKCFIKSISVNFNWHECHAKLKWGLPHVDEGVTTMNGMKRGLPP